MKSLPIIFAIKVYSIKWRFYIAARVSTKCCPKYTKLGFTVSIKRPSRIIVFKKELHTNCNCLQIRNERNSFLIVILTVTYFVRAIKYHTTTLICTVLSCAQSDHPSRKSNQTWRRKRWEKVLNFRPILLNFRPKYS
jgi:hypothetical protein